MNDLDDQRSLYFERIRQLRHHICSEQSSVLCRPTAQIFRHLAFSTEWKWAKKKPRRRRRLLRCSASNSSLDHSCSAWRTDAYVILRFQRTVERPYLTVTRSFSNPELFDCGLHRDYHQSFTDLYLYPRVGATPFLFSPPLSASIARQFFQLTENLPFPLIFVAYYRQPFFWTVLIISSRLLISAAT